MQLCWICICMLSIPLVFGPGIISRSWSVAAESVGHDGATIGGVQPSKQLHGTIPQSMAATSGHLPQFLALTVEPSPLSSASVENSSVSRLAASYSEVEPQSSLSAVSPVIHVSRLVELSETELVATTPDVGILANITSTHRLDADNSYDTVFCQSCKSEEVHSLSISDAAQASMMPSLKDLSHLMSTDDRIIPSVSFFSDIVSCPQHLYSVPDVTTAADVDPGKCAGAADRDNTNQANTAAAVPRDYAVNPAELEHIPGTMLPPDVPFVTDDLFVDASSESPKESLTSNVLSPEQTVSNRVVVPSIVVAAAPPSSSISSDMQSDKMLSFEEWKQKLFDQGPVTGDHVEGALRKNNPERHHNYASAECGAKVLAANPEAQSPGAVLLDDKDTYMLNPCSASTWFVVELCIKVQITSMDVANFELFSSNPAVILLYASNKFPTPSWFHVGTYNLENTRDVQTLHIQKPLFTKFVKIEVLDHYRSEHYCPISLFRVYGISIVDELEDHEADDYAPPLRTRVVSDKEDPPQNQTSLVGTNSSHLGQVANNSGFSSMLSGYMLTAWRHFEGSLLDSISMLNLVQDCCSPLLRKNEMAPVTEPMPGIDTASSLLHGSEAPRTLVELVEHTFDLESPRVGSRGGMKRQAESCLHLMLLSKCPIPASVNSFCSLYERRMSSVGDHTVVSGGIAESQTDLMTVVNQTRTGTDPSRNDGTLDTSLSDSATETAVSLPGALPWGNDTVADTLGGSLFDTSPALGELDYVSKTLLDVDVVEFDSGDNAILDYLPAPAILPGTSGLPAENMTAEGIRPGSNSHTYTTLGSSNNSTEGRTIWNGSQPGTVSKSVVGSDPGDAQASTSTLPIAETKIKPDISQARLGQDQPSPMVAADTLGSSSSSAAAPGPPDTGFNIGILPGLMYNTRESTLEKLVSKIKTLDSNLNLTTKYLNEITQRYRYALDELQKSMELKLSSLQKQNENLANRVVRLEAVAFNQSQTIEAFRILTRDLRMEVSELSLKLEVSQSQMRFRSNLSLSVEVFLVVALVVLLRNSRAQTTPRLPIDSREPVYHQQDCTPAGPTQTRISRSENDAGIQSISTNISCNQAPFTSASKTESGVGSISRHNGGPSKMKRYCPVYRPWQAEPLTSSTGFLFSPCEGRTVAPTRFKRLKRQVSLV